MPSYRPGERAPALACRAWGCGGHTPRPHGPCRLIRLGVRRGRAGWLGANASKFCTQTASPSPARGLCPPRRKTPLPRLSFQAANSRLTSEIKPYSRVWLCESIPEQCKVALSPTAIFFVRGERRRTPSVWGHWGFCGIGFPGAAFLESSRFSFWKGGRQTGEGQVGRGPQPAPGPSLQTGTRVGASTKLHISGLVQPVPLKWP